MATAGGTLGKRRTAVDSFTGRISQIAWSCLIHINFTISMQRWKSIIIRISIYNSTGMTSIAGETEIVMRLVTAGDGLGVMTGGAAANVCGAPYC